MDYGWWISGVAAVASGWWRVAGEGSGEFEFWLNGALRLNLGAARRSAPTL